MPHFEHVCLQQLALLVLFLQLEEALSQIVQPNVKVLVFVIALLKNARVDDLTELLLTLVSRLRLYIGDYVVLQRQIGSSEINRLLRVTTVAIFLLLCFILFLLHLIYELIRSV